MMPVGLPAVSASGTQWGQASPFNYPIAVFSEWRGKAFYLNVRYRARSRRPENDFVVRHTRMTLTGFGRFDLAYFRHTDRWFTVFRALTAAECFREIEQNDLLADDLTAVRLARAHDTDGPER